MNFNIFRCRRPLFPALILTLALALMAAAPTFLRAAPPTVTLESAELEDIFTTIIAKESLWPVAELEISGFSAFPATVTIPAGIIDYRLEATEVGHRPGRQSFNVILLVNGREQQRVRMSANLLRMGRVVMTSRRINRGETLEPGDLIVQRRDISSLDNGVLADPALATGMQLRTTLQAGAIVHQHLLENPPLVRRGDRVTIVAGNARLRVSAPGEVREVGAKGDLVRVRNLMSRKEITGRVVDGGTVAVELTDHHAPQRTARR